MGKISFVQMNPNNTAHYLWKSKRLLQNKGSAFTSWMQMTMTKTTTTTTKTKTKNKTKQNKTKQKQQQQQQQQQISFLNKFDSHIQRFNSFSFKVPWTCILKTCSLFKKEVM